MSAFSGRQHKGAMRLHREGKRREALERDTHTEPERRREHREGPASERGTR